MVFPVCFNAFQASFKALTRFAITSAKIDMNAEMPAFREYCYTFKREYCGRVLTNVDFERSYRSTPVPLFNVHT